MSPFRAARLVLKNRISPSLGAVKSVTVPPQPSRSAPSSCPERNRCPTSTPREDPVLGSEHEGELDDAGPSRRGRAPQDSEVGEGGAEAGGVCDDVRLAQRALAPALGGDRRDAAERGGRPEVAGNGTGEHLVGPPDGDREAVGGGQGAPLLLECGVRAALVDREWRQPK